MMNVSSLSEKGGVSISNIDLSHVKGGDSAKEFSDLFNQHGLMVVRDQTLSKQELVDATWVLGEPEIHPLVHQVDSEVPEVLVLATHSTTGGYVPESEDEIVGKIKWHTDLAYMTVPNKGAFLYAVEIPAEGGLTGFIDRQRVYEALPEEMKARIEGLHVIQSWRYAQEDIARSPGFRTDEGAKVMELDRFPDLVAPLVFEHPDTGAKILNVTEMWSCGIPEMPGEEGKALVDELVRFCLQDRFAYWHRYLPGDVVVWDNWRMMHAASGTRGAFRRLMHRTTIKGVVEFSYPLNPEEAQAAAERLARANATA